MSEYILQLPDRDLLLTLSHTPPPLSHPSSLRPQGHLSEGYGKLCSIYLKLLITKMEFHIKVSMLAR